MDTDPDQQDVATNKAGEEEKNEGAGMTDDNEAVSQALMSQG